LDIVVFKPKKFHAEKSSFYMVAKNVRSQSREATDAIESFRRSWLRCTFPETSESSEARNGAGGEAEDDMEEEDAERMLQDFGDKYVGLMQPVWVVQSTALRPRGGWEGDHGEGTVG
jgi:hypothetical protein